MSLSCSQGDDHDNDYDYDDTNDDTDDDFDDNVKAGCQRTATSWLTGTGRRRALSNTISLRWGIHLHMFGGYLLRYTKIYLKNQSQIKFSL